MKAHLILCIFLASLLFFPSSLLARDLAAATETPAVGIPKKQKLCGGKGQPYKCPRPYPCNPKYGRVYCRPPNSSP